MHFTNVHSYSSRAVTKLFIVFLTTAKFPKGSWRFSKRDLSSSLIKNLIILSYFIVVTLNLPVTRLCFNLPAPEILHLLFPHYNGIKIELGIFATPHFKCGLGLVTWFKQID